MGAEGTLTEEQVEQECQAIEEPYRAFIAFNGGDGAFHLQAITDESFERPWAEFAVGRADRGDDKRLWLPSLLSDEEQEAISIQKQQVQGVHASFSPREVVYTHTQVDSDDHSAFTAAFTRDVGIVYPGPITTSLEILLNIPVDPHDPHDTSQHQIPDDLTVAGLLCTLFTVRPNPNPKAQARNALPIHIQHQDVMSKVMSGEIPRISTRFAFFLSTMDVRVDGKRRPIFIPWSQAEMPPGYGIDPNDDDRLVAL